VTADPAAGTAVVAIRPSFVNVAELIDATALEFETAASIPGGGAPPALTVTAAAIWVDVRVDFCVFRSSKLTVTFWPAGGAGAGARAGSCAGLGASDWAGAVVFASAGGAWAGRVLAGRALG
jgi:hypothetical protein